ncbi:MAG: hypothetical protein BBJ57_02960 [Desulfobacterales bacterium PC51MH44]|nr:MAG: hypothetical protein BBJ57_02960 [Desulfobacterales bacterium PC51MH44]
MRSSIINHPENEPLIIIRQWQLVFCNGNEVAAALMSFFEYWHNIKLDIQKQAKKANEVREKHGDESLPSNLYQWHTEADLIAGIQRIAKTGKTLSKGIDLLESKGIITIHKNPNPRYKFDKTRHFLFNPEPINEWLNTEYRSSIFTLSSSKNTSRSSTNDLPSPKNTPAIPEITPEITKPESLKASSAKADYISPISFLSLEKIKTMEMSISGWKQALEDEMNERGRAGVIKFVEGKIRHWNLLPHNEAEKTLFEILAGEYEDDGKNPPKKFPCRETKRLFNEAAELHNGTLESDIKKAIHKRGKGIAKIVDYINSPNWKKDNSNERTSTRGTRREQQGANGNAATGWQPGNGRSPEMQRRLEAAFAPKPG